LIASVRGQVLVRRADHVVVECSGVGYRLAVSANSMRKVPAVGADVLLHTHLIMRDDGMHLYGFASEDERELFLLLTQVQSVGPKVAMAVLSGGTPRDLMNAIASADSARFQAVPGIGKRTAERIIVELREKVAGALEVEAIAGDGGEADGRALARDGLVNLGYAPLEAERLLDGIEGSDAQDLIATALRRAGTGKAA
jgi:holliday junction DNA helicase RuvA